MKIKSIIEDISNKLRPIILACVVVILILCLLTLGWYLYTDYCTYVVVRDGTHSINQFSQENQSLEH